MREAHPAFLKPNFLSVACKKIEEFASPKKLYVEERTDLETIIKNWVKVISKEAAAIGEPMFYYQRN